MVSTIGDDGSSQDPIRIAYGLTTFDEGAAAGILDFGFWILAFGFWILDFGFDFLVPAELRRIMFE